MTHRVIRSILKESNTFRVQSASSRVDKNILVTNNTIGFSKVVYQMVKFLFQFKLIVLEFAEKIYMVAILHVCYLDSFHFQYTQIKHHGQTYNKCYIVLFYFYKKKKYRNLTQKSMAILRNIDFFLLYSKPICRQTAYLLQFSPVHIFLLAVA